MGEECEDCKRQRYTMADMSRWSDEHRAHCKAGGQWSDFNPEWAKVMCWTMRGVPCNSRAIDCNVCGGGMLGLGYTCTGCGRVGRAK